MSGGPAWDRLCPSSISFPSIGNVEYECLVNTTVEHILDYCTSQAAIEFTTATLVVNCVLDVLSDFASKL